MTLPADFLQLMHEQFEPSEYDSFVSALSDRPRTVSVRLNPAKAPAGLFSAAQTVPWCPTGRWLPARPAFTLDPLFHAGAYYVQESSSMFLHHALSRITAAIATGDPLRVLDLCAAPGGKSTLALSQLPPDALLVANDPVVSRAAVLRENIAKWGSPRAVVTQAPPAAFRSLPAFFDIIIADVPCSGEGMFAKEPQALDRWSLSHVRQCADLQRSIVSDVWPALRPGGFLVYSTCTYNTLENERNVDFLLSSLPADSVSLDPPAEWHVSPASGRALHAYHFYPHLTRGDGFFLSVLRKPLSSASPTPRPHSPLRDRPVAPPRDLPASLLPDDYVWLPGEDPAACPPDLSAAISTLRAAPLRMLHAGVPVARQKGRKWQPHPALALSTALRPGAFPTVNLPVAQALAYLQGQSFPLPSSVPRGYVLISCQNLPLGFVNNLGSRANNLFPAEWRIRTTHLNGGA